MINRVPQRHAGENRSLPPQTPVDECAGVVFFSWCVETPLVERGRGGEHEADCAVMKAQDDDRGLTTDSGSRTYLEGDMGPKAHVITRDASEGGDDFRSESRKARRQRAPERRRRPTGQSRRHPAKCTRHGPAAHGEGG